MGTGAFAVPSLISLLNSPHAVAAAVSQPDRPSGRGLRIEPTPVKQVASEFAIPVWQPASLMGKAPREKLRGFKPDIVVVAAYGKILPGWAISDPPLGAVNIHGSVLPAYRGAAPIQRAIMNGEAETGVTILKVAPEVDTGDILLTQTVAIEPEETSGELAGKLAALGATLIVPALKAIESRRAVWIPQPEAGTDAPKIDKAEARIDWRKDAISIKNIVRGLNPNPGAYFMFRNGRVKIWRAAAAPGQSGARPGTIDGLMPAGPVAVCGEGTVLLTEVQPAGKKAMTGAEFIRGYRPIPGEMLE